MAIVGDNNGEKLANALSQIYDDESLKGYLQNINSGDLNDIFKIISTPSTQEISQLLQKIADNAQSAIKNKTSIKSKADLIKQIFIGANPEQEMQQNVTTIQGSMSTLDSVEGLKELKTQLETVLTQLSDKLSKKKN